MRYLTPPPPRKYVLHLRAAIWNAAFIIAGLLLIALVGEAYLRLANPYLETSIPFHFVDGVGRIREPNAEVRYANWRGDNFVVSRANSLGFLDREPVSAERAAAGCHIAFIGDSYVEAMEVPMSDKFHVRLEEMAARELPHLAITTQAYGITATGQINQLPFYDEYARRLKPKLLVLVFYINDFFNNSPALQSLFFGADPDRMMFMSAQRDARGVMKLRPPDPSYERFLLPRLLTPLYWRVWNWGIRVSYFAKWVDTKNLWAYDYNSRSRAWAAMIAERPCCVSLFDDWLSTTNYYGEVMESMFKEEHLPLVFEEALEYTAFGIDQFRRRADRDGAHLAILSATKYMGTWGDLQFERMNAIAETRGIPVISEYDYIIRQGHVAQKGILDFDVHWNATGHQWAAEAVLEWLKANQGVCD